MVYEMIPLDKIIISSSNVRADEPFGDEEDQALVENIGSFGVLQPIIVKKVGDTYALTAGRRRYLSAQQSGLTEIPCIIKDIDDYESLDISISENLFRKDPDPVTLGKALKRRIDRSGISLNKYARKLGRPASTLSNYIRMTNLSQDMQNEVQAGTVKLTEALKVLKMNLPPEKERELATAAREGGPESFKQELERTSTERETRGSPKGYKFIRINWGLESAEHAALIQLAESEGIKPGEYCQKILIEHLQSRERA